MKFIWESFELFFIAMSLQGCVAYTYVPNVVNVPLFTEPVEVQVSVTGGLNHLEIQTAFTPANNISFMFNGFRGIDKQSFFEGAAGFYHSIFHGRSVFELYGGYGKARIDYTTGYSGYSWDIIANYDRYFIQANLGLNSIITPNPQIAISLRLSYLNYSDYYFDYTDHINKSPYTLLNSDTVVVSNKSAFIIEPVFTFKAGKPHVKFFLQLGVSISVPFLFRKKIGHPYYFPFLINSGIHITINYRRQEK